MGKFAFIESIKLIPIYLLFIGTFGQASLEKFTSGGVPSWFKLQFESTFFKSLPGGLAVQYYAIAILEASIVITLLISAGALEFIPGHGLEFLKLGLMLSLFAFFALGFGLRIAGDFQGAANLFCYFGVALVAFIYVEQFAAR